MKLANKLSLGLLIIIPCFLQSCFGVKPQATKSGKHLYETFYVGEQGSQYFIKPLEFFNPDSKSAMFVDATFRYKDQIKDSVTVNFSIIQSEKYPEINSLILSNDRIKATSLFADLMFYQKKKNQIESRYTSKFNLIDFIDFFCSDSVEIFVNEEKAATRFIPTKKTEKNIEKIKENVFDLMLR